MSPDITLPTGRLVMGHPMVRNPVTDRDGKPKMQADNVTPRLAVFVGVAIPKGVETHWNQTPWGQQIHAAGVAAWPAGEHGAPSFAWKIEDGDSTVPNKKNKRNCDREGCPGHWLVKASTELGPIRSYHAGRYEAHQVIQNKDEIKCGDYCRLMISAASNKSTDSPGIYINPHLFELSRAGIRIETSDGPSAADAFGGAPAQLPPGAMVDTSVPPVQQPAPPVQQPAPPTTPHTAFVANAGQLPPPMMTAKAQGATYQAFIDAGFDEARMIAEGYMLPR